MDEAAAYLTRAGTARDQVGDDAGTVLRTYGEAIMASDGGQNAAARVLFVLAYDGFQRLGVVVATGLALAGIAVTEEHLGETRAAEDGYQRLLRHAESSGVLGLTATALEGLARAALTNRAPSRTAELLIRATAIRDTTIVRPRRARPPRPQRQPRR